jgi:hypothetical protein
LENVMALREPDPFKKLRKKSKKSRGTYPFATMAFYGPDTKTATKVVVGILKSEGRRGRLEIGVLSGASAIFDGPRSANQPVEIALGIGDSETS